MYDDQKFNKSYLMKIQKHTTVFLIFILLSLLNICLTEQKFESLIKTEIPKLAMQELPKNFWWGNVNGKNYLTVPRNQQIPQFCGSCWAFSVTSSLNDRIKIMRNASWPDIILSPQVMISCDQINRGCDGGNPPLAFKWIHDNNITDQTCSPYQGIGRTNGLGCSSAMKCKSCSLSSCSTQSNAKIYTVSQYGVITQKQGGEAAMMNQIYQRGPIVCQIAYTDQLSDYKGGILHDRSGKKGYDHDVSVTGWGEENGTKYWIIRNSWGTYWGENGDFRLVRGIDNLGIQSNCSWGVPLDTWTKDIRNVTASQLQQNSITQEGFKIFENSNKISKLKNIQKALYKILNQNSKSLLNKKSKTNQIDSEPCYKITEQQLKYSRIVSPLPSQTLNKSSIPLYFDWRNVNNTNYLSISINQNSPLYCDSCWATAAINSLSDRINIAKNRTWPDILLSTQFALNCQTGGTCKGGNALTLYQQAHLSQGIPQQTCQSYTAKDPQVPMCSNLQKCKDFKSSRGGFYPKERYAVWRVMEYGSISGVDQMKAQIYARGPITCALQATAKFHAYTGGLFAQALFMPTLNHQVSIVGWGNSDGIYYWIGRNSWGTTWGQSGFFRIQMYRNNNGIQTQCSWASVQKQPKIIDIKQSLSNQLNQKEQ